MIGQRQPIPVDRRTPRRGVGRGGYDTAHPMTLAPGFDDTNARYPGTLGDTRVFRDRGPYYQRPTYIPPGDGWKNWTADGPARPELHMRNVTFRIMAGNSASRYPLVNTPTGGLHTNTEAGVKRTVRRYVTAQQMVGARVNRLALGQYAGQTYSQTTTVLRRPGAR